MVLMGNMEGYATLLITPIVLYFVLENVESGIRSTVHNVQKKIGRRMGLDLKGTVLPRDGHTHFLIQSSPATFITSVDGEPSHVHVVKLSELEMRELSETGHITVETDIVNSHSHTVSITI